MHAIRYGVVSSFAHLVAAFPAGGTDLLAAPAGFAVNCADVGVVKRNAAGTDWISDAVLGPYTWAQLQAAYQNGSGALAALPKGIRALVEDTITGANVAGAANFSLRAIFQPNAAGTRWTVAAPTLVYSDQTISTGAATNSPQLSKQCKIPARMLRSGTSFRIKFIVAKSGLTDSTHSSSAIRMGTTNGLGEQALRTISSLTAATNRNAGYDWPLWMADATTITLFGNKSGAGEVGGSGNTTDPSTTVTIADAEANDIWITKVLYMTAGGSDTPQSYGLQVWLLP